MTTHFTCDAAGMHDSISGGRVSGSLTVEIDTLVFTTAEQTVRLPLSQLNLSRGGANNKMLFLTESSVGGWSIYTRDWRLLTVLLSTGEPQISSQVMNLKRGHRSDHSRLWIVLGLLLLSLIGLWSLRDSAAKGVASILPISWEQRAGEVIFGAARGELSIIEDDELRSKLKTLAEPIVREAEKEGFKLQLYVMRSDDLNAFALPGGYVVVTTELIKKAERVEEIQGVLAHEFSHVTERHSVRQLISVVGIYWVADLVLGNFVGSLAALSQAAPLLLQQSFSRDHEREADARGLKYLLAAKIDPRGMQEFFKRVMAEQAAAPVGDIMDKHLNFLSTHPATQERIDFLETQIQAAGNVKFEPQPTNLLTELREAIP